MSDRPPPPSDQEARDRIATDLDTTLFVEAGAGSGKTTALVTRVVALVTTGAVPLQAIAAITFTEKAGAELRDRVRQSLEQTALAGDDDVNARCRDALDQLDGAAIGTLHSFAQRLLTAHPVEAGLPPRVEVLDEVSSGVAFERRWRTFRDELLADPDMERTLLLLLATGVKHEALRSLAAAFDRNWDLVSERVPPVAPDPPTVTSRLGDALAALDKVCAERSRCLDPADKLCVRLDEIAAYAERLRGIDDELDLMAALDEKAVVAKLPSFKAGGIGSKPKWGFDLGDLRDAVRAAGDGLESVRREVADGAHRIGAALRRFTLDAAEQRRQAGQLEFHDLLVLARQVLRDPVQGPIVRASLRERYHRLLLDEFQDTDPIQIELAVRIACADPATADQPGWADVDVEAGRLFVVGDPKQSIYRFRRADIALFLEARDRFGPDGGGVVELTTNFRSGGPAIDWVNATFSSLFGEEPDVDVPVPSQPAYVALDPVRGAPPVGPPLTVLGRTHQPKGVDADSMREVEAADVAAAISQAVREGWSVDDGHGAWRAAALGDIAVLVPARTSLPFLEDALEEAGIPYRAESSSLVYATRAVRDLLMVLRAVDDPSDDLRIVSALRTPLFGCGDDDLFRFKVEAQGRWSYLAQQPGSLAPDDPVGLGLAVLREWHEQRRWCAPSEMLDRIARDRRALELGFAEGRPRDVWRRLRFVIDQARAWSEVTGGSLREYLAWVEQQTAEGARVAEAVLPETDDDAVRIMTIHAAKGLEFPITILSGMTTAFQGRYAPGDVHFPRGRRGVLLRSQGANHRVRGLEADRRADGLRRAGAAPLRGQHPGPGPPGGLPAPQVEGQGAGQGEAHQRRTPARRHGGQGRRAPGWWRPLGFARVASRRTGPGPGARLRAVERRAGSGPRTSVPAHGGGGHRPHRRGHPRRGRRARGEGRSRSRARPGSRPGQAPSRPRSAAVGEGSLRHGCRSSGARRAADDRFGLRCRSR
ncbi:MAG: UvrD-helicase domain-containing protein [Acidimicrobiales bacterium]